MRRAIGSILILAAICCACCFPVQAQKQQQKKPQATGNFVEIVILDKQQTTSSNPNEVMYSLKVQFTNKTKKSFQLTNNDLYITDASGKKYFVNRLRFAENLFLEPDKPVTTDRVYFMVPGDARIQTLVIFKLGKVLGQTAF